MRAPSSLLVNSAEQTLQGKESLEEWIPKLVLSNTLTKWQMKLIVDKCAVMHMGGKTHSVMVSELAINSKISFLSGFIELSIILSIQQQSKNKQKTQLEWEELLGKGCRMKQKTLLCGCINLFCTHILNTLSSFSLPPPPPLSKRDSTTGKSTGFHC